MELLAPAGGRDSLLAAVHNGADAVYLGYTAFGARAGAGNFDEAGLMEAIHFCHLHHVRVYVTVNTLVKEKELGGVFQVLSLVNRARADAVLLQDLGAAALARDCFPDLVRHASTQMSIHNAQGAEFLKQEGFRRAVLARECSLQEVRAAAEAGLEVEVFVHGAMCVCVSGQCLFSGMAGGRSGNRGRCAQPCRMAYELNGKPGNWLSPRDIMLRDKLPELEQAGVSALKIEGRLKRPEYVAVVTRAYRRALDALNEGRFSPADEAEKESLRQIFHRGGFMEGYAFGNQDAGVIDPKRVSHGGVILGKVTGLRPGFALVKLLKDLDDGDGLQFRGASEGETTYSGPDVKAGETALIRLREGLAPKAGDELARLTSARQMREAMAYTAPPIPVDAALAVAPGETSSLTVTDGEVSVTVSGETVALAKDKPLNDGSARRAMEKTGDTAFALRDFRLQGEGGFLPVSQLNALRREALAELEDRRAQAFGRQSFRELPVMEASYSKVVQTASAPRLFVQSADASLGKVLLEIAGNGAPRASRPTTATALPGDSPAAIFPDASGETVGRFGPGAPQNITFLYAPEEYTPKPLDAAANLLPPGSWLVLPVQTQAKTLSFLRDWANAHRELLAGVVLGSIGQAGAGFELPMAAGPGVPVMNGRAAAELHRLGCAFMTVSQELNEREIRDLPLAAFPFVLPVYGRTRLMTLNHCPARTALGLASGHAACRLCERDSPDSLYGKRFADTLRHEFPLLRTRLPEGCLVGVYNTLPLNLSGEARKVRDMDWLVTFTTETAREQLDIAARFAALRAGLSCPASLPQDTAGHFHRGVE